MLRRWSWGPLGAAIAICVWPSAAYAPPALPDTFIDTTPPAQTNQTSATFTFHSDDPLATFECRHDTGSFGSCTSPRTIQSLSEGTHTFYVRAVNGSGPDPTPASYTWSVDLTPPSTTVTAQPPALSNSRTAEFDFSSPDATATFQCSLNGSASHPCTSPVIYTGLADGTRTFLIQAVDPAGNVDTLAAPITWTVDATAPDTTLTPPKHIVASRTPKFTFTSSDPTATFQCSLGKAPFAACTSPDMVYVPHSGNHRFRVRAVDPAGNVDHTPAVFKWTSDVTPPHRPSVGLLPDPTAKTSNVGPGLPTATPVTGVTFVPPLTGVHFTPLPFSLTTKLRAQWSDGDPTTASYAVTVTKVPGGGALSLQQLTKHLKRTKKTALVLSPGLGNTVCVSVQAVDSLGNASRATVACTTIPDSFAPPWNSVGLHRVHANRAWRHYYVVLPKGHGIYAFIDQQGYEFASKVAVVAERCKSCGKLEIAWAPTPSGASLTKLATIDLTASSKTGTFELITRKLSLSVQHHRGPGYLLFIAKSGAPHLSGIGELGAP